MGRAELYKDAPTPQVSQRMRHTAQRDNMAERAVRSALHRAGYRFRLHQRIVPGTRRTVDIVLPRYRIALFVNGCFWHGCRRHATWPKRNAEFWQQKIEANRARDADTDRRLRKNGWTVVRIWEHDEPDEAVNEVAARIGDGASTILQTRAKKSPTRSVSGTTRR